MRRKAADEVRMMMTISPADDPVRVTITVDASRYVEALERIQERSSQAAQAMSFGLVSSARIDWVSDEVLDALEAEVAGLRERSAPWRRLLLGGDDA